MTDEAAIPEAALEDARCFVRIRLTLQEAALASTMVTALKARHGDEVWQAALNHNATQHAEQRARVARLYANCTVALSEHAGHWMLTAAGVPSPNGWRQVQADLRVELEQALATVAELQQLQHDLDAFVDAPGTE